MRDWRIDIVEQPGFRHEAEITYRGQKFYVRGDGLGRWELAGEGDIWPQKFYEFTCDRLEDMVCIAMEKIADKAKEGK